MLKSLIETNDALSQEIIKTHQINRKITEKGLSLFAKSILLIDRIKTIAAETVQEELNILAAQKQAVSINIIYANLLLLIITLLGILVILISFFVITYQKNKYIKNLIETNKTIMLQNIKIQESSRLKSVFLTNMSHELRTPLNGIIGFTELIHLESDALSEEHKKYLGQIISCSNHLLRLIDDMLDLTTIEAGIVKFSPEKVDITALLNEVNSTFSTLIAEKSIQLIINIDTNIKYIVFDPVRLKQILYNLISNTIKFTPQGGKIEVHFSLEDHDQFRLVVTDTGVGIENDDIPKLFTEFQQLDSTTTKKFQGIGLGLALTRRIVGSQGGKIGVQSIKHKGSTFFVKSPLIHAC